MEPRISQKRILEPDSHRELKQLRPGLTRRVCIHAPRDRPSGPLEEAASEQVSLASTRPATPQLRPPPACTCTPICWSSPTGGTCCVWEQVTVAVRRTQVRSRRPTIFPAARAAPRHSGSSGRRDHLGRQQVTPPCVTSDPGTHHTRRGTRQWWWSHQPGEQNVHQARGGAPPPALQTVVSSRLATPRGGTSSFRQDFTLSEL